MLIQKTKRRSKLSIKLSKLITKRVANFKKHNKVLILKNQRSNHSRILMMRSSLRRLMKPLKFLLTLLLPDSGDKKLIQTLSHQSRKLLVPRPDSEEPIRN
jgi:hypothetical protein